MGDAKGVPSVSFHGSGSQKWIKTYRLSLVVLRKESAEPERIHQLSFMQIFQSLSTHKPTLKVAKIAAVGTFPYAFLSRSGTR